ncbi:hypothetical protein [Leucobacter salsicius]|uniref:hypothetical protein n=1 Tax=Leucobacter salsicius TaxID=664638 RepID=UPI00037DB0F6|nr:hypothetical protein [Leucobacter salsicius]
MTDQYTELIRTAAASIATTWATPSAEPPPVVAWLAAQFADVFARQTMHPDEGRQKMAEAWADLHSMLLAEALRQVVNRRSGDDWARATAGHGAVVEEAVEEAVYELRRVKITPHVQGLNALTAAHVESLASVLDAGLPIEVVLESSAREVGVAMLIASLGIDAGGAIDGATETMRRVLREQAEQLVAARVGE